jgi:hypothetical protein
MDLKKLFTNLFLKTEYISVKLRIALTILILLHLVFKNNIIEYIIIVFYIPLILSIIGPFIGFFGYHLGFDNKYVVNEIKYFKKNIINLSYKILLLIYIIFFIKRELTHDVICLSIIISIGYYLMTDIKKLYKTTTCQEGTMLIFTAIGTILLEKVRSKIIKL